MGDKHIIPQPPCRRRPEGGLLSELPDSLGLVLWQDLRHLLDWADTPQPGRAALFHPRSPAWVLAKRAEARLQAPELAAALDQFAILTRTPLLVDPVSLADACQEVSAWAEAREHVETALQYAEAAALLDPDEPRRANMAGRLNRNAGDFPRAEVWFERGIGLARKRKDHVEYTRGHLGYGILCMTTGREARARRHLNTASVVAMKEGHEWLAAEAQHDLFHFMTVRGHYAEAELHARRALSWYPKHHPRYPLFVADFAFLLVCQCHFTAAATLLKKLLRIVENPGERAVILSLLIRALAGARQFAEFDRLRRRLLVLLSKHSEWEPAARWNLAEAERTAGLREAAEANAHIAIELARARGDTETERFAQGLLRQLGEMKRTPDEVHREDKAFSELLGLFLNRLNEWAPTRRGRSPALSRAEWAA